MAQNSIAETGQKGLHSSVIGQTAWLLLWPLVTIVLVIGVLYYERLHDLEERITAKESMLLRTVGLVLETGSIDGLADLSSLQGPAAEILSGPVASEESLAELRTLFEAFLQEHDNFTNIYLLAPGNEVRLETGKGAMATDVVTDNFLEGLRTGAPENGVHYCPITRLSGTDPAPLLRVAIVFENGSRQKLILAGDYLLTVLNEFFTESERILGEELILVNVSRFDPMNETFGTDMQDAGLLPLPDSVIEAISSSRIEPLLAGDSHYTFTHINLASWTSENLADLQLGVTGSRGDYERVDAALMSVIPSVYFTEQKWAYGRFLLVLAAALLVPSVLVCYFLAKARLRARFEAHARYREQMTHLEELESKVGLRTRELDDRNLQLSGEIAERLSAENQLKQSNELLSGMLESLDGIIYVADFDSYEILFANEYLKRLFGFDPVGKKCWQFIHSSQDGPCIFCTNNRLIDPLGEPTGPYQWEYQNPFNKKWYAAKDQAIRWSNGKFVKLEIAVDITEQKRLQHFLQEARRQAELAQGIRSRFMALVAHDLKSPFLSITQMLKRILERETFTHRVHVQFLENFVENGHRMLQMIDNLLSMDRFESTGVKLDRTFFDVHEMGQEVLQNFEHPAFEKGVTLVNSVPFGTLAFADRYLYFVVLNNLISNGIKFSDHGGTIELFVKDQNRSMTISVRDNGKGMSLEYARNLFKADVKTSKKGTSGEKGSGLGLIFCQDILKAHHGVIDVESERGVGTVFHIVLPECSPLSGEWKEFNTISQVHDLRERVQDGGTGQIV